ncbi:PASTA domain-containing protein [Kitasatospora sp. NPDC049258]|uniref:PASTA domain-containing protein n=1 Tax=Kitasatospora sp. NPDC049258 TaxID=3155394 RepID=UPI003436C7EC
MSQQYFTTPQPPRWGAPPPPKQSFIDWIKAHKALSAAGAGVAVIVVAAGLAGGAGQQLAATPAGSNTPAPPLPAATPPVAPTPAAANAKPADLPNFVGMGLQSAQDKAQAAGFYTLTSHDALGRSRMQILDRDWKVCSQTPTAGQQPTGATIDLGAVKLDEQCPAQDQGAATPKAGATMPDFRGKSAAAVRDALDRSTSLSVKDRLQDRLVLVESNWQVCTQDPKPGTTLNGQPVALGVVKFEEKCP